MKIWNLIKKYKKSVIMAVVVIALLAVIVPRTSPQIEKEDPKKVKKVEVSSVQELSKNSSPIPSLGKVVSVNEASVRTEAQGEIVGLYRDLGDFVFPGTVIAEIKNSSQRAVVEQAKASLEKAELALERTLTGQRSEELEILNINLNSAKNSLREAQISSINEIKSSYSTTDNIIRNSVDQLFTGVQTDTPELIFLVISQQLEIDIESARPTIENMLNEWNISSNSLSSESSLISELNDAEKKLQVIRDFLNNIALAVNSLKETSDITKTTIDGWRTSIGAARTTIDSKITSISSSRNSLNSKISALEVTQKQYDIGQTGGRDEDVKSAESSVRSAEAGLRSAEINLEKTIIRSPISGSITSINIDRGDFVSAFQEVLTVSNNNNLEIKVFLTEDDRKQIEIGSSVLIDKKWKGKVVKIAPSIDKNTKKIEILVNIIDANTNLTNGESVRLEIDRVEKNLENEDYEISIPISALKVTSEDIFVFTVENNKLISHLVMLGPIIGDKVIVESGLRPDMEIVTDARGFKEGQEVEVGK